MLLHADDLGLDIHKYLTLYNRLIRQSGGDSMAAYKNSVWALLYDASYGEDPGFRYNGLTTAIDSNAIQAAADKIMAKDNWQKVLNEIEPRHRSYRILKEQLLRYSALAEKEASAKSKGKVVDRLIAYDVLSMSYNGEGEVKSAIKNFQTIMSLDTTGIADVATMKELLIPLSTRVKQLKESLNSIRWANRLKETRIILVNIPAARLQIMQRDGSADVDMKVILGKTTWQTPSFAAYIYGITTYPYWIVPKSIAVKEILPRVKRNIAWLDASNIQVINGSGQIIPARSVAWGNLSAYYFPYTFRQSTGCDNSLGVMMFNMNSPYGIYLHDTNAKELFNNRHRFLSHGCVRVEKAMLLAETLAGNEMPATTIDELNSCVKDQEPKEIKLPAKTPLLILYLLAGIENNQLRFYPDVYKTGNK